MGKLAVVITAFLFSCLLFCRLIPFVPVHTLSIQEKTYGDIRRIDYVDNDGIVAMHPIEGYSTILQKVDKDGLIIEEHYFDDIGKPVVVKEGYHGVLQYYENGSLVQNTFVDINDQPTISSNGYATSRRIYNDKNQLIEIYYFDEEYLPIALKDGQYGELREYNEEEFYCKAIFLNDKGKPIENRKGYSTTVRKLNSEGVVESEWYFNLEGEPVDIGNGQYGVRYEYIDGQYSKAKPVNSKGHELFLLII